MKFQTYSFLFILILGVFSCSPQIDEKSELGPLPTPTFEVIVGSTPNEFILKNTTAGAFITQWDLGPDGSFEGQEVTVDLPFKGDYEVVMTTFNRGGHASTSQTITVTQDDPNACFGNFELLTGCGEKTWKIAPEASAIHVGPDLTNTWWGNSESDVSERSCHFDDKYIFKSDGEFEYNNNGDFWADSDGNGDIFPAALGISVGCHPSSDWPEAYKAWDSGIHAFSVTENSLTVTGEGAWIGLYKIGTAGEVDAPQSSVTFNILSLTETEMTIYADYSGVVWRIKLIAE